MDADDIFSARADDPLSRLGRQDLDPLSVAELEARVVELEAEIVRCKRKIVAAVNHRSTADELFKR